MSELLCRCCQNFFIQSPKLMNHVCHDCMTVARRRRALQEATEYMETHYEVHSIVKYTRTGQLRFPPPYEKRGGGLANAITERVAARSRKERYGEDF